jgi:hypothetical protein
MKSLRRSKRKTHKTTSEIAKLVDRGGELQAEVAQDEEVLRAIRAKLVELGRTDLAREVLAAPVALRDFAGFVWGSQAIVTFGKKNNRATGNMSPAASTNFPKQFKLERLEGRRSGGVQQTQDFLKRFGDPLLKMALAKWQSNFIERVRAQQKAGKMNLVDRKAVLRELAIQTALAYPLEEWATIFPDAALAGDHEFIKEIVARHTQDARPLLDTRFTSIAFYWYGFDLLGEAKKIPPLKHWSDKAACEFVGFISGESLKVSTYQQRKKRLGLYSEKPTLVTWAEHTHDGKIHRLVCQR